LLIACGECLAADPFGGGTASQNLLKGCNYNRAEVAALVISEMLSAKDKAVERPGVAPNQLFNLQKVCPAPLPVYRKNLFKHRSPMEANFVADFDLVDMMAAKVPLKYKLLGYEEEEWSPIPSYLPILQEQPLLVGAEEESSGASVPAAAVPAPDSLPGMPDCFLDVPFASLPVAARYTNDSLMAEAPPSWGTTEAERIQPAIFAHEDTTSTHDPASNSCRALRSLPMLSDSWVPRKELWQVMEVSVPGILYGAPTTDKLQEDADDNMRPKAQPRAPAQAEIDTWLDLDNSPEPAPAEPAPAAPAQGGKAAKGKAGKAGKGDAATGKGSKPATPATPAEDDSRAGTPPTPTKGVRMERGTKSKEDTARRGFESDLNAALHERRKKLVEEQQARVDQFNKMMKMPCHFKLTF